ncbi:tumor necrosis factor receptor superfamily member 12A [Bombina bombina]|uniref:tumor necrosis factor receptor superfamily member 12A n=1 Tax=Bombina bombina TaxID=8345 RepID=UPI00235B23D5|nr:tumor necrosis factor receptor superfamily member 12A [Bombina bombina]
MLREVLQTLLLVLLSEMSRGASETGSLCSSGHSWSEDLGKCMDCAVCGKSIKSDFCQQCELLPTQPDIPWLLVGCFSGLGVLLISVIIGGVVYITRCRRKNKFTKPIEETGAHSAEALLIH